VIHLIGCGPGDPELITAEGKHALSNSELWIGAASVMESVLPETDRKSAARRIQLTDPEEIYKNCIEHKEEEISVLYRGDVSLYSGALKLCEIFRREGMILERDYHMIPGVSSLSFFASRLGVALSEVRVVSGHGKEIDPVREMMAGQPVIFFCGTKWNVRTICEALTKAGLGKLSCVVGEQLSYPLETLTTISAENASGEDWNPLALLYVEKAENANAFENLRLSDDTYIRGEVPLSKEEIRSVVMGYLCPKDTDCVWDIGAGTGGVTMELARRAGHVVAFEEKEEALHLIQENREKFGAYNVEIVPGKVTGESLLGYANETAPASVFVGGSRGELQGILEVLCNRLQVPKICIPAVSLETLHEATKYFDEDKYVVTTTEISVVKTTKRGNHSMLVPNSPVFLILAEEK